jgi:hypothetical protein
MLEKGNPALGLAPYPDFGYQLYFASEKADEDLKDVGSRRSSPALILLNRPVAQSS